MMVYCSVTVQYLHVLMNKFGTSTDVIINPGLLFLRNLQNQSGSNTSFCRAAILTVENGMSAISSERSVVKKETDKKYTQRVVNTQVRVMLVWNNWYHIETSSKTSREQIL